MEPRQLGVLMLALAVLVWVSSQRSPPRPLAPAPPAVPTVPEPPRRPCPPNGPCPQIGQSVANGPEQFGEVITCALPSERHIRNTGGSDGAGLCVFAALRQAGDWANEPVCLNVFEFMKSRPGGGYPDKVDQVLSACAQQMGRPLPGYVQHTGGDERFLQLALRTGRYPCVTYAGQDGVFYRAKIAHMVNLVHLSAQCAVIQDNNFPGQWLWLTPTEFLSRWRALGGGWAIILLPPGPPPIPVNRVPTAPVCWVQPTTAPEPAGYRWYADAGTAGLWYLFRDRTQVGTLHPDVRGYRSYDAERDQFTYGVAPVALPAGQTQDFGVETRHLGPPHYRLNGAPVPRDQAWAALTANSLIDDSGRWRLTIVGESPLRQRVRADLEQHPSLREWRERLLVQDYPPEHWAVTSVGLVAGLTVQMPADEQGRGGVLFRCATYPGPEALATALRKADPNYRPERDPDPTRSISPADVPAATWILAMVGVWLFLSRKERA
jgi:hypothetical protein